MFEVVKDKTEEIISMLENTGYFLLNEQQKREYKVFQKEDGSMLTELDLASEVLIKNELSSLFGDIQVISEEGDEKENIAITKEKYFFLLDPIDGTRNFNKGKDFTINLAFCVDRQPVIGFIHNPIKKTILFGDCDVAFKKSNGKMIKLQKFKSKRDALLQNGEKKPIKLAIGTHNFENTEFVSSLIKHMQANGYNFSRYNLLAFSAMEKLLSLVNGEVDAFWTASCCKDWDILPALPILKAINAVYYTENPLVYNDNNFNSGKFISATNDELLQVIVSISNEIKNENIRC